ncbi:hypothetical protein AAEX28_03790 [Lentisphaerota bacterium WC36G]|nr:hypothetical protein LJT99_06665 [Lentisphaerae bacterium WC36]
MTKNNTLKCPNCDGKISFSIQSTNLQCEYCGETIELKNTDDNDFAIEEHDFAFFAEKFTKSSENIIEKIIDCTACSAQIVLEGNDLIEDCPYCGTAVTQTFHEQNALKPQYMLPFQIAREDAREKFRQWQKSLWFAPNSFKEERLLNKLNGVFMPFFTFDISVHSRYTGQRGENYTEHYTDSEGNSHTRTKTRWYSAYGVVYNFFNDVLIYCSKTFQRKFVEELEPWDLENLEKFDADKLRGFDGETYSIDLYESFDNAEDAIDDAIKNSIRRDIGGDKQRIHSYCNSYNDIAFKYLILPVWVSNIKFKNKDYRFYINARTGEVQGERPYSALKITLAILLLVAIIGTLVLVFSK